MTYSSSTLAKVVDGQLCAGCGACAATAPTKISVGVDASGFARPQQSAPLNAKEEQTIKAVCPSVSMTQIADGRKDDPLWGPFHAVYKGHATDARLRHHASSGGGLSALLTHLVEAGMVDFVVQTGADSERPLGNLTKQSSSGEEIYDAAGSRYGPSSPLAGLEKFLQGGRPFAFVGKPCDVAALRAIAKHDDRVDQLVTLAISFFCAGVPNLKGTEEIVHTLGGDPKDVKQFKYRGDGWPGNAEAVLANGDVKAMSYHDSWGKILTKHLQFRCKICPDGVGGFADIVFADAWHCDQAGYPLFDEQEGRSLIVTRNRKGEAALEAAIKARSIEVTPLLVSEIKAMQPGQVRRKTLALSRLMALRILGRPTPQFRGFKLGEAAMQAGLFANLKSFLGAGRRVVLNRR